MILSVPLEIRWVQRIIILDFIKWKTVTYYYYYCNFVLLNVPNAPKMQLNSLEQSNLWYLGHSISNQPGIYIFIFIHILSAQTMVQ